MTVALLVVIIIVLLTIYTFKKNIIVDDVIVESNDVNEDESMPKHQIDVKMHKFKSPVDVSYTQILKTFVLDTPSTELSVKIEEINTDVDVEDVDDAEETNADMDAEDVLVDTDTRVDTNVDTDAHVDIDAEDTDVNTEDVDTDATSSNDELI